VGVDAYFPLSDKEKPDRNDLIAGWQCHLFKMKKCSETTGKPILFTEWGYRNINFAGEKPWDYSELNRVRNDSLQSLLYSVAFDEVLSKDFIAGGFLWKWFPQSMLADHEPDTQFSPQGKLAENVVRHYFKKGQSR
jgi:hypothetical protein